MEKEKTRWQPVLHMLKAVSDKVQAKCDADMKKYGLTFTQSQVMVCLALHGGTATQKEIETFLRVAHPTVVGLVSRMERNGLVETYFDPEDRRRKNVRLTEKAEKVGASLDAAAMETERKLTEALTEKEVRQLEQLLRKIYESDQG